MGVVAVKEVDCCRIRGFELAEAGRVSGRLLLLLEAEIFSIANRFSAEVEDAFESRRFSLRANNRKNYKLVL